MSGFIHLAEDYDPFSTLFAQLDKDQTRFSSISDAALNNALNRFTHQRADDSYAELFNAVMVTPPPKWAPLPWRNFHADPSFKHAWVEWVPDRVKCMVTNSFRKTAW